MARWWQIDPLSDIDVNLRWTPYNYSYNSPILYNDPNGDCPCIVPALPYIAAGIEALLVAGGAYLGYKAVTENYGPDYDNLTTGTLAVSETAIPSPKGSNDPQNWNHVKKAAMIGSIIGFSAVILDELNITRSQFEKWLSKLTPDELQAVHESMRAAENRRIRFGNIEDLTDKQLFGLVNAHLITASQIYEINKDGYGKERGQSAEEREAEEQQRKKGQKASQLLNNFDNVEQGTYVWDGENWVRE